MCLSTAYKLENGNRVVLGSYVSSVEIDGDSIKLTTPDGRGNHADWDRKKRGPD